MRSVDRRAILRGSGAAVVVGLSGSCTGFRTRDGIPEDYCDPRALDEDERGYVLEQVDTAGTQLHSLSL